MPRADVEVQPAQLVIVAMIAYQLGTTSPKNLAVNSERREYDLVLHVTRTQGLIVIVDDGDGVLRSGHGWERNS